jgi:hypothetical protein
LLIFRNMVSWRAFFQQNPNSGSKFSNDHQTYKNRGNNISIISKYEIYQWITVNYDINSDAKWTYQAPSLLSFAAKQKHSGLFLIDHVECHASDSTSNFFLLLNT